MQIVFLKVNILLQTRFSPSVGGIETLALVLCREWLAMGHQITVSTDVAAPHVPNGTLPYAVHYQTTGQRLLGLWRKHDVVVMMNVSLKAVWPMFLMRTPVVFVHQSNYWIDREGNRDRREHLKLVIARRNRYNICASRFIRDVVELPAAKVISNCYDDTVFKTDAVAGRPRSIVFVGRLVSDKGADLLLESLRHLPVEMDLKITIIGDGPERAALETMAARIKPWQIRFTGSLTPDAVARELKQHQILVVPSLWKEPFGIVALEGMACGCVPLVSDGGGLPEAVGEAGCVFKRGDAADLAGKIYELLEDDGLCSALRAAGPAHLARHTAHKMAVAYLDLAQHAVAARSVGKVSRE